MSSRSSPAGLLFHADALDACAAVSEPLFDLVYLDPPFNVGGAFAARTRAGEARGRRTKGSGPNAYHDAWGGRASFLSMLRPRLAALRERMKPHASFWLHLDYRTVHYAKVMCDEIFGPSAFRGEIVWVPGNGARGRGPSVTHQTLLIFSRNADPSARVIWNADDPALREPFAATSLEMHFARARPRDAFTESAPSAARRTATLRTRGASSEASGATSRE
jgi:site-specific DNA-methyltransferase (adenine-specific)